MALHELPPIDIHPHWQDRGAVAILGHPDDEALPWGFLDHLKTNHVPITAIYLTLGEFGIQPHMKEFSPNQMKDIRREELNQAMRAMGMTSIALDLGDVRMSLMSDTELMKIVLPTVRKLNPGLLVSFHPHEITWGFDHPDHVRAGDIARFVGAASDITHFYPQSPATADRPNLYLWTTHIFLAQKNGHAVPISETQRRERNAHLFTHHSSQFEEETVEEWGVIFDRNTNQPELGGHFELYDEVR